MGGEVTAVHRTTDGSACAHTGSLYLKTRTQETEMISKPAGEWITKKKQKSLGPKVARNKTNETKPLIILKSPVRSVTMMRVARLKLRAASSY